MTSSVSRLLPAIMVAAAFPVCASAQGDGAETLATRGKTSASTATLTSSSLPASDGDFSACDGFPAPKGKSDGISRETFLFGAASRSADMRRRDIWRFGEAGFVACNRALADARLVEAFWLRRANLLQGKAVHAIAAGNAEEALSIVDESDAVGAAAKDPYFPQSVGLGNAAVRAYALHKLGRNDDAATLISGFRDRRKWSQSVADLSTRLKLQIDHSFAGQVAEIRARVPLAPERARSLFWMLFLSGDYEAAQGVAPAISFDLPKQRGGWSLRGADQSELEEIGQRTSLNGAWAYAAAATGRPEDAKRLIAEADAELDEIIAPPPPREDGKPPRKDDLRAHARRLPSAQRAKDDLRRWRDAIAYRPMIAFKSVEETQAAMKQKGLLSLPIITDVLRNVPQQSPQEKAEVEQTLALIEARADATRIEALDLPIADLIPMLPKPETAKVVPTLKPAGDGYFLSDSGLSRNREGKSDIWTIRYTHMLAPMAAVEELAMLGAAQTARREGFDSMVILSRIGLTRTTNVSGLYVGSYSQNSGYEAQLRVRFVNRDRLPVDLAGMDWRVLPADAVVADLSPRYREGGLTVAW
jgi:hypothetical protein